MAVLINVVHVVMMLIGCKVVIQVVFVFVCKLELPRHELEIL